MMRIMEKPATPLAKTGVSYRELLKQKHLEALSCVRSASGFREKFHPTMDDR